MDNATLGLFLLATFLGGLTSGIAGFAMGMVVSGMWLHIITPVQTATLIVGYGLLTQGYAVWKLKHAFSWRRVAPFIAGGVIGVPVGAILLTHTINPVYLRPAFGSILVLYSIYSLARPAFKPLQVGVPTDVGIGVINGVMGGLTGLTGIIVTIWCQVRGWSKDEQRAVFQPVNFGVLVLSAISLSVAGTVTTETAKLYALGLPFTLGGLWIGLKLYGTLDEASFRKLILVLLLVSGLALTVPLLDPTFIERLSRFKPT